MIINKDRSHLMLINKELYLFMDVSMYDGVSCENCYFGGGLYCDKIKFPSICAYIMEEYDIFTGWSALRPLRSFYSVILYKHHGIISDWREAVQVS